ncbi:hypothetical protein [Cyanobium sp. FACHB-13342]|uniref:hypothetical protein n=1 Tax=Cyanobium sp. FACHB-13342 TaxID=2692793 RepID=UPI0016800D19|nr:hypothetical protein [Cyanobium sp. FACHB-13342]MBD2422439.1 hypothetical protein [Cyanobium sp. FACHB-13342]
MDAPSWDAVPAVLRPTMPDLPNPGSSVPLARPPIASSPAAPQPEPVLCQHCGRTASNGISCQGSCVADSGY